MTVHTQELAAASQPNNDHDHDRDHAGGSQALRRARRVLIVDDSRAIQALIRRCLDCEALGPLQIETASDGLDALTQVARFQPDLVLADWHMPGASGLEMLQRLRQAGFEQLPVGFITMDRGSDCQRRAQQHGALFLLHKPFAADELRQAVAQGLGLGLGLKLAQGANEVAAQPA